MVTTPSPSSNSYAKSPASSSLAHQEPTDDDQSMISGRDSKETWLSEMDEKSSADREDSGDNKVSSQEGEVY
jgi:hypothetical protein